MLWSTHVCEVFRKKEGEEHNKKNIKRSGTAALATVVASVALLFGASAPASAIEDVSGYVDCPFSSVVRISFKATGSGYVWVSGRKTTWTKSTATRYAYSANPGWAFYGFTDYSGYVYNVSIACVPVPKF